jgi:PAS domain S-box-containing protein
MAYSLAFAALDGNNQFPPLTRGLNLREREQLRISMDQLAGTTMAVGASWPSYEMEPAQKRKKPVRRLIKSPISGVDDVVNAVAGDALPRTLQDALRPSSRRAVVVTETTRPFRVVDVNSAWVSLCGYSYVESKGKSLGSLLRGPETDPLTVTALLNQLLRGEEATAIVTNYTKEGRKFLNRLTVGPLYHPGAHHVGAVGGRQELQKIAFFVGVLKEVTPSEMLAADV